jgi:hypothetical protein
MSGPKISKHNTQELSLTQNRQEDKTSLWGKRSLIFTHTNNELFQGLLDLTKQKSNALSESFEENERDSLFNESESDAKNEKKNPFHQAKMKAMLRNSKDSIKTA